MKLRTSKKMPRWAFLSFDLVNVTLEFQPGAPRQVRCWKITYDASGVPTQTPGNDDRMHWLLKDYVHDEDEAKEDVDGEQSSGDVCEEDGREAIESGMSFPDHGVVEDPQEDKDEDDDVGDKDTELFSAARTKSCGR